LIAPNAGELGAGTFHAKRREFVVERMIVGKGEFLRVGFEEKVEGIQHRHFRYQIHFVTELLGLLCKDKASLVIRLWVLLPVNEVFLGRDA
jgi:hypothetical protein